MDSTELHYLTYDPNAILTEMLAAYIEAGGDPLRAGDEKEMLLQAVLQVMVQAFAGMDNALRMDTLRYAVRDYLDVYGEKRGCVRIPAAAARATVQITMSATGVETVIEAGTAMTADGEVVYATAEDLTAGGYAQTLTAEVVCTKKGSAGNSLVSGMELQPVTAIDGATQIVCTVSAVGGQDKETDDAYRERIRTWGLASVTTGPRQQYEAAAKAVSSEIIDARAVNLDDGEVGVYVLTASETGRAALLAAVEAALNDESVRPLTDTVTVEAAEEVPYTLNVEYSADGSSTTVTAINAAVAAYQTWQDGTIGRAFNPDRLAALLYQAGATRVIWGEDSVFDEDGEVEYTEIEENQYCSGTISLAVISA